MFGNNSAAIISRVVSSDVSNHEPNNESAGQIMGNPVIYLGSHTNDKRGTTADVHSDPESKVDNISAIKAPFSSDEDENNGSIMHHHI